MSWLLGTYKPKQFEKPTNNETKVCWLLDYKRDKNEQRKTIYSSTPRKR
jgi:hypothetical protein